MGRIISCFCFQEPQKLVNVGCDQVMMFVDREEGEEGCGRDGHLGYLNFGSLISVFKKRMKRMSRNLRGKGDTKNIVQKSKEKLDHILS